MPPDNQTPATTCLDDASDVQSLGWDCEEMLGCFQRTSWRPSSTDEWPADRWGHAWCIFSVRDDASLYGKPSAGERARLFITGRPPEVPADEMTPQWVVDVVLRCAYAADLVSDAPTGRHFMDPSCDLHDETVRSAWCVLHDALTFIKAQCDQALRDDSPLVANRNTEFAATYSPATPAEEDWFEDWLLDPGLIYNALWDEFIRRHIDRTIGVGNPVP